MTRIPGAANLFSAFASKRKAQEGSPTARPQQDMPASKLKQHTSYTKTKLSAIREEESLSPKAQSSSPQLHSTTDSGAETRVSSPPTPTQTKDQPEPTSQLNSSQSLSMQPLQRQQPLRTSWSAEADYSFVRTLARHTSCDGTNGLHLNHSYVDQVAIQLVEDSLSHNVDAAIIARECSSRFPNKNDAHYSAQSIELLGELSKNCPGFSLQQLNQKHMNMWTRTIVPFRQVFETGMLYKSKPLFHKDCKRFSKVFINFLVFVVQNGIAADYCPTLIKSTGQASKLLEQWIVAMFEHHGVNMSHFMFQCGLRLCRAYIRNKQTIHPTASEHAILSSPSPSASDVLVVLKSYFGYICEYEGVTPAVKFEMDSRNIQANNSYANQAPADPSYIQQMAPRASSRTEAYPPPQAAHLPPPAYVQPAAYSHQASAPHPYSPDHPYTAAHPSLPAPTSYSRPSGHWPGDSLHPAPPRHNAAWHPSDMPPHGHMPAYPPRQARQEAAQAYYGHNHPYRRPTNNTYSRLHPEARRHGGYDHPPPPPVGHPPMRERQPISYERWSQTPKYGRPALPSLHARRAANLAFSHGALSTLSPVLESAGERDEDDYTPQPARPTPSMETKHSTKGQAVDNLFNDVFDHFDASPSSPRSPDSAKLELLEETDNKPSSCMRISPPSASPSKHTSSRSILN